MLRLKRVYEKAASNDGYRILVDRLWPRGVTKVAARVDLWFKDIAPSPALRTWFGHDPERWDEFRERYFAELEKRPNDVVRLRDLIAAHPVTTLVYAAKDPEHTHALALKDFVERRTRKRAAKKTATATKRPRKAPRKAAPRRSR